MAEDLLTQRPQFGKTFTIAMWALGGVAVAQVLAVGLAVLTQPEAYRARQKPSPTASADSLPSPRPATTATRSSHTPPSGVSGSSSSPGNPAGRDPIPLQKPLPVENYDPFAGAPAPSGSTPKTPGTPGATTPAPMNSTLPPLPDLGNGGLAAAAGATLPPASPPLPSQYKAPAAPAIPPVHLNDSLLPTPQFGNPGGRELLSSALSNATLSPHPAHRIEDPILRGLVTSGAELRGSGNMQGSLNSLRQAEAALPNHPRVLSEIAATYSELGLAPKAVLYWEKVRTLGAEKGGAYFDLAGMELKGQRLGSAAARRILRIGSVNAAKDPALTGGERVVLKVTIEAEPGTRPSAADMAMLVYFYDQVNGEKWEASTADTSQNFVTAPYDWQDGGRETIEVVYHQPVFSETQKRELGERAYYGYVIELYYRDELQGTAAEPPGLKLIGDSVPEASPDMIGPDNSLFPDPPSTE